MPREKFILAQNLVGGSFSTVKISTQYVDEDKLSAKSLSVFSHARPLGISPGYSEHGRLVALAISDDRNCRVIRFKSAKTGKSAHCVALLEQVLCRPSGDIYAFDMCPLVMSLYFDFQLHVTNAVDIQSAFPFRRRDPFISLTQIVAKSIKVDAAEVDHTFRNLIYRPDDLVPVPTRAWLSQFLATYEGAEEKFSSVPRINTNNLNKEKLQVLAKLSMDALRLDIKKPTQVTHSANVRTDPSTHLPQLESIAYSFRIRSDKDVVVAANGSFGTFNIHGTVGWAEGRINNISTTRMLEDATDITVTTFGREDATSAEARRASILCRILQGAHDLLDNPWVRNIWFPHSDGFMPWPDHWTTTSLIPQFTSTSPQMLLPLNKSQQIAVNTMLSDSSDHRLTLVQGPPGTGKTSVIATFVQLSIVLGRTGIWIVAQSNVAVKNVAEKLIKVQFTNWRLLVSKDFHFDWHEHLYSKLKENVIRSDDFLYAASRFDDNPVILCTLSMLSNKHVMKTFMGIVPVNHLVVDEASQIEIGNFMPTFIHCHSTLRKVSFIGDNKQLPPHGQEDIKDLQSIFEVPHLTVCFLDTQYRMPPVIGTFISQHVYQGKLNSNDLHPVKSQYPCKFIDAGGKECSSNGSYENQAESSAIIKLALKLQKNEKSYHIITPYTGQRDLIERGMKKIPGLKWEDKCFTVDSFQGNEDDYIIISIVRSMNIGFMKNLRRANVMLTRCKRGMFIFSTESFCKGPGSQSLVGKMAKGKEWISAKEIERSRASAIDQGPRRWSAKLFDCTSP